MCGSPRRGGEGKLHCLLEVSSTTDLRNSTDDSAEV